MSSFTFYLFFIPVLAIILLAVNFIFAIYNPNAEKRTAFECGFHSFLGQNRSQFSISFFIFALLFLLFDLEILLIYPYALSSNWNDIYGLIVMLIFFILLTIGFIFELGKKALVIYSKQNRKIRRSNIYSSISFSVGLIPVIDLGDDLRPGDVLGVSLAILLVSWFYLLYKHYKNKRITRIHLAKLKVTIGRPVPGQNVVWYWAIQDDFDPSGRNLIRLYNNCDYPFLSKAFYIKDGVTYTVLVDTGQFYLAITPHEIHEMRERPAQYRPPTDFTGPTLGGGTFDPHAAGYSIVFASPDASVWGHLQRTENLVVTTGRADLNYNLENCAMQFPTFIRWPNGSTVWTPIILTPHSMYLCPVIVNNHLSNYYIIDVTDGGYEPAVCYVTLS